MSRDKLIIFFKLSRNNPVNVHNNIKKSNFSDNEKLSLLEKIWSLILIDGVIDPYEENLFYRIGELIKVKRSKLNLIKSRA